ncbi:S8 family serine peptidase [Actinoplanes sp. NPDC049265]|uniref:S8 family serine peptidase n=1 Tax=Actinoplanes sp. NPDC049265 TaxID=3363902 RepID=UPI00371D7AA0
MPVAKTSIGLVSALTAIAIVPFQTPAKADAIRDREWHLGFLHIAEAQKISTGAGVSVAVVDTGVHPHPDLKRNLKAGTSTLPSAPGDGTDDKNGHGTAMAGLIAGHGRTGDAGILGIAPAAKIIPVRSTDAEATEADGFLSTGIAWAAQNGAQVINVSGATAPTVGMRDAIDKADEADAVVVASSGNRPQDSRIGYPAAMPGVLAVGAVDRSGMHAAFSVEGDPVQICAPGVEIETTRNNNRYSVAIGTSPAAAIVSGAAALVRAKFPDLSAPEVIARLTSTATDIGPPGRDKECGFGVLNIVKALTVGGTDSGDKSEAVSPAPTQQAAPGQDDGEGAPVALIVGGVVVVLGGLAALFVARRRRRG